MSTSIREQVHIDVTLIPNHVRDDLAAATLDFIHEILHDPESRAKLEDRLAKKKAAMSAE